MAEGEPMQKVEVPEQLTQAELASLSHGDSGGKGGMSNLRPLIIPLVLSFLVTFAFFSFKDPTPKADFLASIGGINKVVDELRGGDKAINDRMTALNNTITAVQGTNAGQQAKIDQIAGQITDLSNKVTAAQTTANNANSQLANYALKASVDALAGLSGRVDSAIAKADSVNTKVDSINNNVSTVQKDVASLKESDKSVNTQLADLKQQITDLKAQIASGTTSTAASGSEVSIDVTSWSGMTLDLIPGFPGSVMFNFKVTNNTIKTLSQLQLVLAMGSSTSVPATFEATGYPQLRNMNNALETWQLMTQSSTSTVWTNTTNVWGGGANTVTIGPKQSKTWLMQYTMSLKTGDPTITTIAGVAFYPQIVAQNYTLN